MIPFEEGFLPEGTFQTLCSDLVKNNRIPRESYERYQVKRGLRNADGSGVMAGLSHICNVHGYVLDDGEKCAVDGRLIYRGIDLNDLVDGCVQEKRFGFEETIWLLLFGTLPTEKQLSDFTALIASCRELPEYFVEDMIIKAPSPNIMNKIARSVLALYSYDPDPENSSVENLIGQSIRLIATLPTIMVNAYQVKRRHYDKQTMYFHPLNPANNTAQAILNALRIDNQYTEEEARLLDLCLMLHAEHGGGNNSTFTTRVVSSSGTDTYSAISSAVCSLKGHRHGGANIKVVEMLDHIRVGVKDCEDDEEIAAFLKKIMRREAGDGTGLIYGMGHAVYTVSDPRAVILHRHAKHLAEEKGFGADFRILEAVERLTPRVFAEEKGVEKAMCANVDLYSGLVYRSLGIPSELFTPMFAVARIAGWCAHRIEEAVTGKRIIRPAYKSLEPDQGYVPLHQR
ncbi:MAG: citrate/2-methylcitrate synthase [Clostridiales bacterium]|nr:citrate/2-methylcitrate synthase [Clostridiales bacterium]